MKTLVSKILLFLCCVSFMSVGFQIKMCTQLTPLIISFLNKDMVLIEIKTLFASLSLETKTSNFLVLRSLKENPRTEVRRKVSPLGGSGSGSGQVELGRDLCFGTLRADLQISWSLTAGVLPAHPLP